SVAKRIPGINVDWDQVGTRAALIGDVILLPKGVFLLPKLISFGNFYLPTYGVLVALGFLAGLAVTVRLARRSGLSPELITNLAVYCALAGLLGAKPPMIAFGWPDMRGLSLSPPPAAGDFPGRPAPPNPHPVLP